jgi:hypothetical protein
MMAGINETLLRIASAKLGGDFTKRSFQPMPGGAAPMPPMDPGMDPAMAGMDPSMMPAAMGMDPAQAMAAQGLPMDPAMAMAGGVAPGMAMDMAPDMNRQGQPIDPGAGGGLEGIDPALQAAIDEAVAKATGGSGEPKTRSAGKISPEEFAAMRTDVGEMKGMLQKVIGFLMGTGQMKEEALAAPSLGAADAPPPPVVPPEKTAAARPGRKDELLATLAELLS